MVYSLTFSKGWYSTFSTTRFPVTAVLGNILQVSPEKKANGNVRQRTTEPEVFLLFQSAHFHFSIVRLSGFLALLHNYLETCGEGLLFSLISTSFPVQLCQRTKSPFSNSLYYSEGEQFVRMLPNRLLTEPAG